MLHGGFGTGLGAERSYHWDDCGGALRLRGALSRWHPARLECGRMLRRAATKRHRRRRLSERVDRTGRARQNVDRSRIYITGMSNGAMMAYRMACEAPLDIAAIGPVAGTLAVSCERAKPTSVLAIHGLADQNVPFEGGVARKGFGGQTVRRPVTASIARWREIDGCAPPVSRSEGQRDPNASGLHAEPYGRIITDRGSGPPVARRKSRRPPSPKRCCIWTAEQCARCDRNTLVIFRGSSHLALSDADPLRARFRHIKSRSHV